jgi:lactate dehydrogenase-like 2-hydroxyacid dehydrogenase
VQQIRPLRKRLFSDEHSFMQLKTDINLAQVGINGFGRIGRIVFRNAYVANSSPHLTRWAKEQKEAVRG